MSKEEVNRIEQKEERHEPGGSRSGDHPKREVYIDLPNVIVDMKKGQLQKCHTCVAYHIQAFQRQAASGEQSNGGARR